MDATERRKLIMDYFLNKKVAVNPDYLYRPRESDIIVIGPPKSGTTWMQQILHQIRTKGDESFDDIYAVTCTIYHPDSHFDYNCNIEQVSNPRIFKHHEPYGVIPLMEKQKKFFIVRDPYDAAYSWLKFIDRFYGGDKDINDDDMSELMMSLHKNKMFSNYNCMATWWEHRLDSNVMFLFYEDLKRDLPIMIQKIAHFVHIPLTEEELARVVHFCSFDYMSKHKEKFQGETAIHSMASSVGIEDWKPTLGMVREDGGKIGEGANIGPKLKATVDLLWAETMERQYGFKSYQEMYKKHSCFI